MGINKTIMKKIKKALISVSNKSNLKKLLKTLVKHKIELISSGGTYKEIKKLNDELDKFKKTVEESNDIYETMLDKTTKSLEKILLNTESNSKVQ